MKRSCIILSLTIFDLGTPFGVDVPSNQGYLCFFYLLYSLCTVEKSPTAVVSAGSKGSQAVASSTVAPNDSVLSDVEVINYVTYFE